MNVTDALEIFALDGIKVGKEEAGTSSSNQSYDKFQTNQEKAQTRQILELSRREVHEHINQWKIIVIISTAMQKKSYQVWTDSLFVVNFYPCHPLYFSGCIKKI